MKDLILLQLIVVLTQFVSCQKTQTIDLKIMTFNIRYGTAADGENSWEHRKTILINCLKKHHPDILGTQETLEFQVDSIKAAFPQWRAFGVGRYHTVAEPERPHESMSGESCTILYDTTKFSLIEQGTFWHSDTPDLPASITWDNTLPRITTWGILEHREQKRRFVVLNTHFHWGEPYVRKTSELIMRKWRDIAGSMPTILMGDFNLSPESESHELFCSKTGDPNIRGNFIDCWQALHKSEQDAGTSNNYNGTKSKNRIDWILTTPDFVVGSADIIYCNENGRYPSDHYPVLAHVKLNK